MTNEEIKEKYGIELIGKEMWVWNSVSIKDAELAFVVSKDYASPFYNYIGYDEKRRFIARDNASETNPNKTKEPKVGDKGYFWNEEKVFYAYGLLEGIDKEDVLPYLCEGLSWHPHFSHEKQPWMK
jgi:hypothetical protein